MGIEKFFNSIKKTYGSKIINKLESNTYFQSKYLLLDFNSIIHNISQSISYSLIYLNHIFLISNVKSNILHDFKEIIEYHIQFLKTDYIIELNINLPDQSTISDYNDSSKYIKNINFNELNINDIDESFFRVFQDQNILDNYIIHKVTMYVISLIKYLPKLELIYIAIDGVPSYGKMLEQKKRRIIGYILEKIRDSLLEFYKSDLNIEPNINNLQNEIYYNHYEFESKIKKFKFNKNKISPGTQFMTNLETYLSKTLKKHNNILIEIDSNENRLEGEKKIVFKIHQLHKDNMINKNEEIIVYSPDADVILLMLMELDKSLIKIFRYDQGTSNIDIIDINQLKKVIIDYMMYSNLGNELQMNIIKDIVMIFTILGNDFLPRIETINTSRDIKNILNSYQELNQRIESDKDFKLIYRSDNLNNYQLDFETLTQFFINLKSNIKEYERYKRSKEWNLQPDQIININAIPFYRHIFNIENLANIYDTSNDIILPVNNKLINLICRKYLVGFIWLGNYYLNHNIDYEFFYYKYNNYPTPTINQLIYNLKIINKNPKMLYRNLEKSLSNSYFNRSNN